MKSTLAAAILFTTLAHAQPPSLRDPIAAMQRGDFTSAERQLRAEVAAHPDEALALSLLGATLDQLQRISEAGAFHDRAVAQAPRSADILSNYAAHLWIAGRQDDAIKAYLRVVAIDAAHPAANLQLARHALQKKDGAATLRYLDRLPPPRRDDPQALLLRLEALYLTGDTASGDRLAARLFEEAQSDANLGMALVTALTAAGQYAKAEAICERALKANPANFNALYDLGVVATYAGHYDRAREVLDTALRLQPRNVDALYALARVHEAQQQYEAALVVLARAATLDPQRADVQKMIALAATELGALDDALAAWDRYLKLESNDEVARRERSFLAAQKGQLEEGIAGLEQYVEGHPAEAVGHYELGQALRNLDASKAIPEFDKALQLDPNFVPARTARGSLYYQQGKPEAAWKDLEAVAALRPNDAPALDRLGQVYASLDRTVDAVRVLRRAAELAPDDPKILLHLSRSLADAGNAEESKAVIARFRQLGPEKQKQLPAGFVEYLALTDEQRRADYRTRVEKELRDHPNDAGAHVAWMKILIEERNWPLVDQQARAILELKAAPSALADAGRALAAAQQYALAAEVMAGIPEAARDGEYYLLRAQMLYVNGKAQEVGAAMEKARETAPPQPDFYHRAACFLVTIDQAPVALRFLDRAVAIFPGDREMLLLQAAARELATGDAEDLLTTIRNRWPEWYPGWVAYGVFLKSHGRDATQAMDTAKALGAPEGIDRFDWKRLFN